MKFVAKTYLTLLAAVATTALSSEYPADPASVLGNFWLQTGLLFALIFALMFTPPGLFKWFLFALFVVVIGQTLAPLVSQLQAEDLLQQVLLAVGGVFGGMTVLALMDTRGRFLRFGPALIAGLLGLILAELLGLVVAGTQHVDLTSMNAVFAGIGTLVFAGFVAYDTQKLQQRAQNGDVVDAALGLFLDVVNLFTNIGSAVKN